jgi:glucosamine 6-phosphate synthetase-like amidotransferase/phosphosugar isomerase protein
VTIDCLAGLEVAVPASKSVTSMAAILLWAAALTGGKKNRTAATLVETAEDVRAWLDGNGVRAVEEAAQRIARRRSVAVVAAGYGVPVAYELALKIKEASYVHAEGFPAGEFRPRATSSTGRSPKRSKPKRCVTSSGRKAATFRCSVPQRGKRSTPWPGWSPGNISP